MTASQQQCGLDAKNYYSPETEKFLRDHFRSKDVDRNGFLDIDELAECLKILGIKGPSTEELEYLKIRLDSDGDGHLKIEELLANVGFINSHLLKGRQLMEAFRKYENYDENQDRQIQQSEMLKALMDMNKSEGDSRALIRHIYQKYDLNSDSRLSYAEFVNLALDDDQLFLQML